MASRQPPNQATLASKHKRYPHQPGKNPRNDRGTHYKLVLVPHFDRNALSQAATKCIALT